MQSGNLESIHQVLLEKIDIVGYFFFLLKLRAPRMVVTSLVSSLEKER